MKIKDIFKIARIECSADANDISDETLLVIFNEILREFLSNLQSKKYEEFFSVSILNDIVPEQYKYGKLEFLDSSNRKLKINKILKVRFKGENIPRTDVLGMDEKSIKNIHSPSYGVNGEELFIYHKEKEVIVDGIEVIGLCNIPEAENIESTIEDIFLGKLDIEYRILKLGLKPFIYEKVQNINASINTRNEFLQEMKRYINKLGRIKEPINREIPNLSRFS